MGLKRAEKRVRKEEASEENNCITRKGVAWRLDRTRCIVEMRPPHWRKKLHFGSHGSEAEAMVARDYGAFLRASAGESVPDAGGFDAREHKLYYFQESPGIFESMTQTKARRASILRLYPQMVAEDWSGEPPHLQFCKDAREDIAVAIRLFREHYPHRLTSDGASSSSSSLVRVSPGSSSWANLLVLAPVQIAVATDGSPRRILVDIQAPLLDDERIIRIFRECIRGFEAELNKATLEKLLEDVPPCTYDPMSIPAIDDPEWKV